jgi:hypothetical protein
MSEDEFRASTSAFFYRSEISGQKCNIEKKSDTRQNWNC